MSPLDGSADARSALLAAAREELEEHGVAAVSLRAVARRAGLSHAAPGYLFGDRAGMLTALATEGFVELAEALEHLRAATAGSSLERLGSGYVDFGLRSGALFDLMFQRDLVHPADPDLQAAQQRALAPLLHVTGTGPDSSDDPLMSWALVHGLVTLARQRALPVDEIDLAATVHRVVRRFAHALRRADAE